MSENPQQPPQEDPGRPSGEPPPQHGHQPYGQQPYAHQPYPYRPDAQEPYGARPGPQPDPGIQDPGLYPGVEQPPSRVPAMARPPGGAGNFFSALFDYSFHRYITPTIVKVVYVVITILVALGWLGALIAAFQGGWLPGVLFLLFGWIVALVYLAIARITLEFFVAVISVAEKVTRYAERDGIA